MKIHPVQRAFAELDRLAARFNETVAPGVIDTAQRGVAIIESTVDRPVDEKNALKAVLVLQFGKAFAENELYRIRQEYNVQAERLVGEILKNKSSVETARLRLATEAAMAEVATQDLKDPQASAGISAADAAQMLVDIRQLKRAMHVEGLMADMPRLTELAHTRLDEMAAAVKALPGPR